MSYNIHPIFVHFPIAMLFLYSIIKVLPFKKWFPAVAWRQIERALLVVGVLGAFAALATGDTAEHLLQPRPNRQLVEMHSTFGALATWIYGALLLGEIAAMSKIKNSFVLFVERVLCNPFFSGVLAALGFIAIAITGMLGGVIAYGLTADPIAPILLKLLGISL